MKKVVICLAVLLACTALGWGVRKAFDSEKAGYIVAVVAMAATIAPIFLSESNRRFHVHTSGDNSPGIVGGNYSVNSGGESSQDGHDQATPLTRDPDSLADIKTIGDFSPAVVGGNYVVNRNSKIEITHTTVRQEAAAKRKVWRELDVAVLPPVNETPAAHAVVFETLLLTLVEMFAHTSYTEFVLLANLDEIMKGRKKVPAYLIVSYQPGFCSKAHRKYVEFVDTFLEWRGSRDNPETRTALEQKRSQQGALLEGWTRNIQFPDTISWLPIRCVCDSVGRSLTLEAMTNFSVNPASYADHLTDVAPENWTA